jgi:glucose/arabinose dehydrogenase
LKTPGIRRAVRFAMILVAGSMATTIVNAQTPASAPPAVGQRWETSSDEGPLVAEVVATGFSIPQTLSFMPDGRLLVADRFLASLTLISLPTGARTPIRGLPPIYRREGVPPSQGAGLHDVVLHPQYDRNGWMYFAYSEETPQGSTLAVDRARLQGDSLVGRQRLFVARHPLVNNTDHFGGRLALNGGYLWITSGERFAHRDSAQSLTSHYGKVLRLHEDGRIPTDNPLRSRPGALPEIWSFGHRNALALGFRPGTNDLWSNEHGPRGGDEVNIVAAGANYGWPVVTYGEEYEGGPVGAGSRERAGLRRPVWYYKPSIGPSGMLFYTGALHDRWRGNLFIGAMALRHLNRLVLDGDRVIHEERLFTDQRWRVRSVAQNADGAVFLGVDGGFIVRVTPGTAARGQSAHRNPRHAGGDEIDEQSCSAGHSPGELAEQRERSVDNQPLADRADEHRPAILALSGVMHLERRRVPRIDHGRHEQRAFLDPAPPVGGADPVRPAQNPAARVEHRDRRSGRRDTFRRQIPA